MKMRGFMNLKRYKVASTPQRRLLAVIGNEVLTNPGGKENGKSKVMASSNIGNGCVGINRLLYAVSVTNRTR